MIGQCRRVIIEVENISFTKMHCIYLIMLLPSLSLALSLFVISLSPTITFSLFHPQGYLFVYLPPTHPPLTFSLLYISFSLSQPSLSLSFPISTSTLPLFYSHSPTLPHSISLSRTVTPSPSPICFAVSKTCRRASVRAWYNSPLFLHLDVPLANTTCQIEPSVVY